MNYTQLQNYCQNKVLTIEIKNNKETVKELKAEWLTANNLIASEELTNTLTRFYQSLTVTINQKSNYHPLPDQISTGYFDQYQPLLGKIEGSNTATTISAEHYQLLDQIIADFQQENNAAKVTQLQERTKSITSQLERLLKNKLDPRGGSFDANLMAEMFKLFGEELQQESIGEAESNPINLMITKKPADCQPWFKILLSYPESQPIVTDIKQ
jgi:regulator of sigma D